MRWQKVSFACHFLMCSVVYAIEPRAFGCPMASVLKQKVPLNLRICLRVGRNNRQNRRVPLANEDHVKVHRIAQAMFASHQTLTQSPRMAAAVTYEGEVVSFYGHLATEDTFFRIASMSKSFTAAAVLLLRDEGALQLDESVVSYAPELTGLRGPTTDAPPITCRQLLTMTSGLTTDDPWADRHLDISNDELTAVVNGGQFFAVDPGTAFEYSNLGYGILGRVIERVSGRRAQDFITQRLLLPLGMTNTIWDECHAAPGSDLAIGMRADGVTEEVRPGDGGLATMGGLWSTVNDLTKWIHFFTDSVPARDGEETMPLRRSSRREMQRIQSYNANETATYLDGARMDIGGGYGMGLLMGHHEELGEMAGHSGGVPGYGSNMRWVKGTGFGLVALANTTYGWMAGSTRRVLDALVAAQIVRKPELVAVPAFVVAAKSLAALLADWNNDAARRLFANNVDPDESLVDRGLAARALVARVGEIRYARIELDTATEGTLVLQSAAAEHRVWLALAPLGTGVIQKYDLPT
jgi:CubicO group peptidase (beta-lactamase class C family)